MDGVIADFFGGLEARYGVEHWKDIEDPLLAVKQLKNTDFFSTLWKFETSDHLVTTCRKIAGRNFGICSSPIDGDEANSAYWKRKWLIRHNYMPEVVNLHFTKVKAQYAAENLSGEPNILVDDKPSNINEWNAAGGIGLLYQANENSVEDLINDIRYAYS